MPLYEDTTGVISPVTLQPSQVEYTVQELLLSILNELKVIRLAMTFIASEGNRIRPDDLDPNAQQNTDILNQIF